MQTAVRASGSRPAEGRSETGVEEVDWRTESQMEFRFREGNTITWKILLAKGPSEREKRLQQCLSELV